MKSTVVDWTNVDMFCTHQPRATRLVQVGTDGEAWYVRSVDEITLTDDEFGPEAYFPRSAAERVALVYAQFRGAQENAQVGLPWERLP
jgi:hypothetical protein